MTIAQARQFAFARLQPSKVPEPARDTDLLLSHVLQKDAAFLVSHAEAVLSAEEDQRFRDLIERRAKHEPIAYLIGFQPFYGYDFAVTPDVLIPRPESELIIDKLKQDFAGKKDLHIVEVGTGSGNLAVTAALAFPAAKVLGIDVSPAALAVAKNNAKRLGAFNTTWIEGNLLAPGAWNPHPHSIDAILANLPYLPAEEVAASPTSKELAYEPQLALLADDGGLALIKTCVQQALPLLKPTGKLYLEMLPGQIPLFLTWLMISGLRYSSEIIQDLSGLNRIVALTKAC